MAGVEHDPVPDAGFRPDFHRTTSRTEWPSASAITGRFCCSSTSNRTVAVLGSSAPRQRRGRNAATAAATRGFFTESLASRDPELFGSRSPIGTRPPAPRDRADRIGKHRLPRRDGGAGVGDDQQIRRRLSGQALLRRLPVSSTSPKTWRSTAPASCSAAALPTCSRTRAARPTRACSGADQARRHHPWDVAGCRRPPDPRRRPEPVGQVVQRHPVRRAQAGPDAGL
jgi:hypothetical protein